MLVFPLLSIVQFHSVIFRQQFRNFDIFLHCPWNLDDGMVPVGHFQRIFSFIEVLASAEGQLENSE